MQWEASVRVSVRPRRALQPVPPAPLAGAPRQGEKRSEGGSPESSRVLQTLLHKRPFVPRVDSKSFSPLSSPANSHWKQAAEVLKTKQRLNQKSLGKIPARAGGS